MSDQPVDPEGLFAALHKGNIDYVLIGAFAAVLHGSPLPTMDLDICPKDNEANLAALAEILKTNQFGRVDVIKEPSGTKGFADLNRDAVTLDIDGIPVRVASLRDIIRSKQASGRETDLAQLPVLRKLLERSEQGKDLPGRNAPGT